MIIESIELENFGPFMGSHRIDLGTGDRSITLIHGENMSGKTSILNAVRWALYGRAYDRFKNVMPTRKLVNRDALEGGQRRVSVRLRMRSSNAGAESSYILKRLRQAHPDHPNPRYDEDFQEFLDVEKDHVVHTAGDFGDIVAQILPFGISRFFLFDGEMLDEYETLVAEQSEAASRKVREDIKAILGVPAVVLGRDDMAVVKAEFGKKLIKEAKLDKLLEEATRNVEEWEAKKAAYYDDLRDSQQQLKTHEAQLAQVEAELDQIGDLKEDMGQVKQLRVDRDEARRELQSLQEERRKLSKDLWRDVLAPRTSAAIDRLRTERDDLLAAISERNQLEKRVADLRSTLSDTLICPTCGQKVTPENLQEVRTEYHKVNVALRDFPEIDESRLDALSTALDRLQSVSTERVAPLIVQVEKSISKEKIKIYKKGQEIERIEERLLGINEEKADENLRLRRDTERLISIIQNDIDKIRRHIEEADKEIDKLTSYIQQQQRPALKLLQRNYQLASSLETVFSSSIDELIRILRNSIQDEASQIFRNLTTDKAYTGLQINDNFGLTIKDALGRDVEVRSAAAEQIVALSLIGALNRLAVKRGPVFMDTPFGRLDPRHRANVLGFIPSLADQVVLLIHSGEFDRKRDLPLVANHVAYEYEVIHETSTKSTIEPIRGVV